MWFMMVTMTTVGYGDVSPLTDGGKVVTTMAMLFGVLFLAMPLAIVGNNFCLVWEDKERVVFVEKLKEQLLLRGRQPKDMRETFNMMDTDGSGSMSFREFRDAMRVLEINMSAERLAVLWRTLDADHSGEIDVSEFMELVYRDDPYVLVELGVRGGRRDDDDGGGDGDDDDGGDDDGDDDGDGDARAHARTHARTRARTHAHARTRARTHAHTRTRAHARTHAH